MNTELKNPTDFKVQTNNGIVTSEFPEWQDPTRSPPPTGVEMMVLQRGGTVIKAPWSDDAGYLGWYPLPRLPKWLKDKRHDAYFAKVRMEELPTIEQLRSSDVY